MITVIIYTLLNGKFERKNLIRGHYFIGLPMGWMRARKFFRKWWNWGKQGQSWKILSGGGYYQPHRTFVDEMWAAYRILFLDATSPSPPQNLRGR